VSTAAADEPLGPYRVSAQADHYRHRHDAQPPLYFHALFFSSSAYISACATSIAAATERHAISFSLLLFFTLLAADTPMLLPCQIISRCRLMMPLIIFAERFD